MFIFLIAVLVTVAVSAANTDLPESYVEQNEFLLASFHSVKNFIGNGKDPAAIEDACYWLLDNKDKNNIKYVSFLGDLTAGARLTYDRAIVKNGMSSADWIAEMSVDEAWHNDHAVLKKAISVLTEEGLPYSLAGSRLDHFGNGYSRTNLFPEYFPVGDITPEGVVYESYDDSNYYMIVEHNGVSYIIFTLDCYTITPALDWFNNNMTLHPDKRAIVFTPTFVDKSGEMYTMWDWENGGLNAKIGNSDLRHMNMANGQKPRDGEALWNYAFSKHDNLLAVISSRVTTDDIITSKFTNANGVQVASIAANSANIDARGATVLLTKISEDNKTLTCEYYTPFVGIVKDSKVTINLDKIGTLAEPLTNDNLPQVKTQYNGANNAYILGYEGNLFKPNNNMTRAEACTIFARLILGTNEIPTTYTTRFTDVKKTDWFYGAVAFLDESGFFWRLDATTYKPNEPITRAEFVDLANSASTLTEGTGNTKFNDVDENHFYYSSIVAAASSGLVNGYEDKTFRPDNTITRAEVVTVINRLLGLRATDKTVSPDRLENTFKDITTHWAKLNILMASNSNVHGEYYYNANLDGVTLDNKNLTFENDTVKIAINRKTGKVTEVINKYTGDNINKLPSDPFFVYIELENGNKVAPVNFELDGNRIRIDFKNETCAYMLVEVEPHFMTFEIDSQIAPGANRIVFANIGTNLAISQTDPESFRIGIIGMSAWTQPNSTGIQTGNTVNAYARPYYAEGTMGAKAGIVFSKLETNTKYLQELTDIIDKSVGLVSKAGGAYALEFESNFGDYVIISDANPEVIKASIPYAVEYGIDQIDFHQGGQTFRQGDFFFYNTENGTAKEFYENTGKLLEEAGIESGLHTYAYYISSGASNILTVPKWQQQLETLESYTLRKNVTKFSINLPTEEDASGFDRTVTFFYKNSLYLLVDEEIIRVGTGTSSGFINVARGQCGTTPAVHTKGTEIKHLSGYFNMLCPVLGSELFYHIADLTAEAYNDGGFSMIYLDAIDGLNNHLPKNHEQWYYFNMFIQRILSQCEKDPVLETSSGANSEWNVRGRKGAWDTCSRGINRFVDEHVKADLTSVRAGQTATLGWFAFFPDASPVSGMRNTIEKTLFHDDMDNMGYQALVYNFSIVYSGFNPETLQARPHLRANMDYYNNMYSRLRKSNYFTEETLEKVKANGGEFKVIEKAPGEYAFLEMYYQKDNVGTRLGESLVQYGNNPFKSQTPFVRIESRWSTLFENEILLADFDETKTVGAQTLSKNIKVDMTNNMVMKLDVTGTGRDGDALLISLTGGLVSGESGGRIDYFIDLNFSGTKEVVLLDADSGEYDTVKYVFKDIATTGMQYATYRKVPNYADIVNITVRTCGDTATEAIIGDVKAYTQTEAPVENPTLTVGSSTITFNATLKGGEYVEYDPLTNKAYLYHADQTIEEVTFTGKLSVSSGDYTCTYSANALTDAPLRARVVLGFAGEEITN